MRARTLAIVSMAMAAWASQAPSAPVRAQTPQIQAEIAERGNAAFDAVKYAPKIVGGPEAPPGSYPWQVSLQRADHKPGRGHYCAASIHNERWLVTAAHCLENLRETDVLATPGTHTLSPTSPRLASDLFIIHKLYRQQTEHDYDIGLIRLAQSLVLGAGIQPIAAIAPADEAAWLGKDLVVTGWGATQEGGDAEKTLREISVPLLALSDCSDPLRYGAKITNRMLCVGYLEGGKGICNGDSGGPLSTARDGSARLVGLVSWGGAAAPVPAPRASTPASACWRGGSRPA
jgi:secreted trypsin-like serine protease